MSTESCVSAFKPAIDGLVSFRSTTDEALDDIPISERPLLKLVLDIQRPGGLADQDWRCFDCAARMEDGFMYRARYCEYTGMYFCRNCHDNSASVIPARVLHHWDFGLYPFRFLRILRIFLDLSGFS